jgi:hypothetical protein
MTDSFRRTSRAIQATESFLGLGLGFAREHEAVLLKSAILAGKLAVLCALCYSSSVLTNSSSAEPPQVGKILGVRRVLRGSPIPISRYPRIRDFDVYFAVQLADQTYCADYETVVLDEIDDLMSCAGKDVGVMLDNNRKHLVVYTAHNRKLKARIVEGKNCANATVDAGNAR